MVTDQPAAEVIFQPPGESPAVVPAVPHTANVAAPRLHIPKKTTKLPDMSNMTSEEIQGGTIPIIILEIMFVS